jgi:hypothetical protein
VLELSEPQWPDVADALATTGWARLPGALDAEACAHLARAAPDSWVPETLETQVRLHHVVSGAQFEEAGTDVQALGSLLSDQLGAPAFTDVTWCRDDDGVLFITPHRDPPGAGGVIAIVTLHGEAVFRVWGRGPDRTEWTTAPGDLVLLRGNGWPTAEATSPWHEVESPTSGGRATLTLRHNKRGWGGDYFATD